MAEITRITKVDHFMTKEYNPRENKITAYLNGIVAMLQRSTVVPTEGSRI